jgi:hypothetical protein
MFDDDIIWQSVVLARRDLRLIAWALARSSALLQTIDPNLNGRTDPGPKLFG